MRDAFCWRDKTTESLDLFQFGMTSEPSTARIGEELLTWFREASRASTLAWRARCGAAEESGARAAASGPNTSASSQRSSPHTFSGRTPPRSAPKASTESFESLPASGSFADGSLSELRIAECRTSETASGSLLPTPTARDWKDTPGMTPTRRDGKTRTDRLPMLLFSAARSAGIDMSSRTDTAARTVSLKGWKVRIAGGEYSPELPEWLMGWPIGWTDCAPLGTDRFLAWQLEHSDC